MVMIVVRNVSNFRVGVSSSYQGAHGRPLYLNLGPNDSQFMNGEDLKNWGPGAKEALASYAQNGTLQVDEVPAVHEAHDTGHKVPNFSAMDLQSALLYADALRNVYNAHCLSGGVHTAADTANVETTVAPTDLLTLTAFLLSFQGSYNAHIALGSAHPNADTFNVVSGATGTVTQNIAALNELQSAFTMHKKQALSLGAVTLTVPQIITY